MKSVFKYPGILVFPFTLSLPLPLIASSVAFAFLVLNLIFLARKDQFNSGIKNPYVLLLIAFFLIDGIRSLIFEFPAFYIRDVKLAFVTPIFFLMARDHLCKLKRKILISFALGIVIYIIYAWIYVAYFYTIKYPHYELSLTDGYIRYILYNYLPGNIHHTYLGMYIDFIVVTIYIFTVRYKELSLWKGMSLIVFFSFNLLFLGGKGAIILLILLMTLTTIVMLRNSYSKKIFYSSVGFLVLIITCAIVLTSSWLPLSLYSSIEKRLNIYNCTIEVGTDNLISGIGYKNIRSSSEFCEEYKKELLPHSSFLNELVANGLLGFFLLVMIFLFLLKKGVNNSLLLLNFSMITATLCITESILSRQHGVLFFVFFSSVLYLKFTYTDKVRIS